MARAGGSLGVSVSRRLWRYLVTSALATACSEGTLVLLYGSRSLGGWSSGVVGSLIGTMPSYVLSRYWIWSEADRRHLGRQIAAYWLVALVGLVVVGAATGLAAAVAPGGHSTHTLFVAAASLAAYGVLWVAKFVAYQKVLFVVPPPARR